MTVQRFTPVATAAISLSEHGEYVKYEDYERLAAKLSMINGLMDAAEQTSTLAQEATEKLVQERDALAAENAAMKQIIDSVTDLSNEPQYHSEGMGCGLEDRGITDRYEAMRHGWDEAMERIYGEVIPCAEEIAFPETSAFLAEVRAQESAPLVRALTIIANSERHDGETMVCDFDSLISVAAGALRDYYAAQIRKGDTL